MLSICQTLPSFALVPTLRVVGWEPGQLSYANHSSTYRWEMRKDDLILLVKKKKPLSLSPPESLLPTPALWHKFRIFPGAK